MEQKTSESLYASRRRLPYGAVPLDAWNARHPAFNKEKYLGASIVRIESIFLHNYAKAIDEGILQGDGQKLQEIGDMVERSLYSAQTERITYHAKHHLEHINNQERIEVQAARIGLATPAELLSILVKNKDLESIELAKQSHPFYMDETADMEDAVAEAVIPYSLIETTWQMRTKVKKDPDGDRRVNLNIPAAILVHKRPIGVIKTENGDQIEVVERRGILMRGDEHANSQVNWPLDRLIKNPEREDELLDLVHRTFRENRSTLWLPPLTTSYYAHRLRTPTDAV